jgi:hypothetical protein
VTTRLPFTQADLAEAIRAVEDSGKKVVGVTANGTLLIAERDETDPPVTPKGFVYFVTDGEFVKIGYSFDWRERLLALQTSNARELKPVAIFNGTQADEAALHRMFAVHRVRNEWFHYCAEIKDYLGSRRSKCQKDAEP